MKINWIEIENCYPPDAGYYLIYGRYTSDCPKKVYKAYFDHKKRKFYDNGIISKDVSHWMTLPKPPVL